MVAAADSELAKTESMLYRIPAMLQAAEAKAEQAVYNRRTDILKLIGEPVIEMPQGTYTGNRELEWDNGRKTVIGSDYKITVKPEALKRASESQKLPGP